LTSSAVAREHAEVLRTRGYLHMTFGGDEIEAALDYLELEPSVRALVIQRVTRLRTLLEEVHREAETDASTLAPAPPLNPLRDFAKACGMSPP
jgi:hypothetical protein